MKAKKCIIPLITIVIIGILISCFVNQIKLNGSTLKSRELRLRKISKLGETTTIEQEISIDGYIISGYTTNNNQHGLAVFTPTGNGKHEFQQNINKHNDELIFLDYYINSKFYTIVWANKADLDYAEITYTVEDKTGETIKLDAQNDKIIYTQAPSSNHYSLEYRFIDKNGKIYE